MALYARGHDSGVGLLKGQCPSTAGVSELYCYGAGSGVCRGLEGQKLKVNVNNRRKKNTKYVDPGKHLNTKSVGNF